MPSAIAFFPWIAVDEPITIGPLRLLPYHRGKQPGALPHVTQADIDSVLSAYANRPRKIITRATILEFGHWQSGMDAQEIVSDLFRARNALAFAALSRRQLFQHHFGYCNYDSYSLVVQRYQPGYAGTFAFSTRRRDGGTNQLWSSDEFAFHRPNHVEPTGKVDFDESLLAALLDLPERESRFFEALTEFNCANTDSPDVPEHVEVVMMKSAFEWLLQISEKANEFVEALSRCLHDIPPIESLEGPLKQEWQNARSKAARPLEAWAREFCDVRGASAHGKPRKAARFVWPAHIHLAFASLLFPLVFKKVAAQEGLPTLAPYDVERLKRIDAFLLHDPFQFDWLAAAHPGDHPWAKIDLQAFSASLIPKLHLDAG
jgi:hypothetical protein